MRWKSRVPLVVALPLAAALGLYAGVSTASKSFTLAMEKTARESWDASFNKTIKQPFSKLACTPGQHNTLKLGDGCVDTGDSLICCSSWSIEVECTPAKIWQQQTIDGSSCEREASKDESAQ